MFGKSVLALALSTVLTQMNGTAALATEVVLSYSPWNPSSYGANDAIFPWFNTVEKVTEGRVRIVPRAAAVGAPRDQADAVAERLVDMSLIVTGYTPGRFPLMDLFSLPLLSEDAERLSAAAAEIYYSHFAQHDIFKDADALTIFVGVPAQLAMIKAPVATPADLGGKKLYISNRPTAALMDKLGASAVSATVAEVFAMASGGIIDGAVFGFESTQTFGLKQYLRHFSLMKGGLGQASWALLVNREAWNEIAPADRAAIMAISGPVLGKEVGAALMRGEERARKALLADGTQATAAPTVVQSALDENAMDFYDAWLTQAKAAGLADPAATLGELRALLDK